MCGAPHYHILLWIENAPVFGINRSYKTGCHKADSNTSPDLNFW